MMQVSFRDAKTNLSKLMRLIENNCEDEIQISRNGRPVVRMTSVNTVSASKRIGVAEGRFEVPDALDAGCEDIASMLAGGDTEGSF